MLLCKKTRNGPGHWVFECFDSINNLCSNFSFIITTCCQYLQQKKRTRWTACDLPRSECPNSTPKHSSYQLLTAFASCWQFWQMLTTFNKLWSSLMNEDTERRQEKEKTRIQKEIKKWLIQKNESYIWCLIARCSIIVTIRWPHIMLSVMVIFFSADKDVDRFSASLAFTFLQKERCNGQQWSYFLDNKT